MGISSQCFCLQVWMFNSMCLRQVCGFFINICQMNDSNTTDSHAGMAEQKLTEMAKSPTEHT